MGEEHCITIEGTNLMTHLGRKLDRSLCIKAHADHVVTESSNGLWMMRVRTADRSEQKLLVLLYQILVLSSI